MLRVEKLSKKWKDFELRNVSFEIQRGEHFIILGPSGAGKTLLLETIAGIFRVDEGEIWLDGEEITDLPPEKRNIAYVPQNYALFPHLTVYENISYGLKLRKRSEKEIKEVVEELSKILGIEELLRRKPKTLSGGEQQRVAIARALAVKPKLLLLDEPFSNLDAQMRSKLIGEMKRWREELGFTALHVTHSFEEAVSLGDRIGVMMEGEMRQVGEVREIFSKPKSEEIAKFLGYENIIEGIAEGNVLNVNGLRIEIPREAYGRTRIGILPENIILSKKSIESSARNSFRGTVEEIEEIGSFVRVRVSVGFPLVAYITRASLMEMGISKGSKIYVSFKTTSIHIFD